MRLAKGLAIAALTLTGCGAGYGLAEFGLGIGVGLGIGYLYGECEDEYDDCHGYYYAVVQPASVAPTDFDADGSLDAVLCDAADGRVWLARGDPIGGFRGVPSAVLPMLGTHADVAVVNANGDAFPDLLVLDGVPGTLSTWAGDGRGGFAALASTPRPTDVLSGVVRFSKGLLDGDAIDDVVTLDAAGRIHVALGTGTGTFADVVSGDSVSRFLASDVVARLDGVFLALGGFDAAPGTDLLVLDGGRGLVAVFSGAGDGTFGDPKGVPFPEALNDVLGVAAVTLGADQPAYLATLSGSRSDANAPSALAVVRPSDGAVVIAPMAVGTARSIVPFDVNRDGATDLLLADESSRAIRTLYARRAPADASAAR